MSENVFNNQNISVKCEPKEIVDCQSASNYHTDFSTIHKDLALSPLNYDIENVDLESINIDDIFNETQIHENWCSNNKDEFERNGKFKNRIVNDDMMVLSNVFNPGDTNSLSYNSTDAIPLAKYSKINSCPEDNKIFLITDILNKDKFYLNSSYSNAISESSLNIISQNEFQSMKPHLSLLLNTNNNHNSYVENPVINNDQNSQHESILLMSTSNSNININSISNQNTSQRISKTKTILPIIGPSPRKKCIPVKSGKFSLQLCGICSDNATGKHYGVVSCEGCKGFFKRTVRNTLSYTCRDLNNCAVDKKFRNRCQACRFQKCLQVGMKREAVQIERPDKRLQKSLPDNCETVISSPSSVQTDESLEKIHSNLISQINSDYMMQIEIKYNPEVEEKEIFEGNVMKVICQHLNEHLFSIVSWAKYMPGFTVLSLHDQTLLIKMCWGELVVANFTHRSLKLNADMILMRNGTKLVREMAELSGIGKLIDRIIYEILHRFRDLKIDKCELSYIKGIILFNPNLKDLENRSFVQMIRDKLYTSLQNYCLEKFPTEKFRFSKLLLRLPSLRSIAHNCLNHLRFYDIIDKCKSECSNNEKSSEHSNDKSSEESGLYSFLDEMLGHSDIIMDH